jgi:hypothetical protein
MVADGVTFRRMLVGIALAVLVVVNVALIFLNIHKNDRAASASQQTTPVTTVVTSPAAVTTSPSRSAGSSSVPSTTVPTTQVPSTTVPRTTVPRTTAPRTTAPSTHVSSSSPPAPSQTLIRLSAESGVAQPYQTLRLTGRYGKSNTVLRAQQYLGGRWVLFPLPTITNGAGKFSTYVELAQRGPHRLRMLCPSTGARSNVVSVTVL